MLSNKELVLYYQTNLWKLIPYKWRHWWLPSVRNLVTFRNVSVNHPAPIFEDRTESLKEWNASIESGSLGRLIKACNTILIPTILCPWGCTEYCHQHGTFHVDILFQHMMRKCSWTLMNPMKTISKIESSRNDYLRDDIKNYEELLFNPNWKVLPSVVLNKDNAPMIMTCRIHDGGTLKSIYTYQDNLITTYHVNLAINLLILSLNRVR